MHASVQTAHRKTFALAVLIALLAVIALAAISLGSISIAPSRVIDVLLGVDGAKQLDFARDALVITQIRIPRLLLGEWSVRDWRFPALSCKDCFAIRSPIRV